MPNVCQGSRQGQFLHDHLVMFHLIVVQEGDLLEVVRSRQNSNEGSSNPQQPPTPAITLRRNDFRSSTKLEALVQRLRQYLSHEFINSSLLRTTIL